MDATATQNALVAKGFTLNVDGKAGPKTFAALLCRAAGPGKTPTTLMIAVATSLAGQLEPGGINTPLRIRHFLAQAACETWAFKTLREDSDGHAYEGSRVLGNTQPGDGLRFIGRGLLDTTGRWNYQQLHALTGLDCVDHPELLEVPDKAVLAAVSYWNSKHVNAWADKNDIRGVTFAVNGGYNGLSDRQIYFDRLGVIQ